MSDDPVGGEDDDTIRMDGDVDRHDLARPRRLVQARDLETVRRGLEALDRQRSITITLLFTQTTLLAVLGIGWLTVEDLARADPGAYLVFTAIWGFAAGASLWRIRREWSTRRHPPPSICVDPPARRVPIPEARTHLANLGADLDGLANRAGAASLSLPPGLPLGLGSVAAIVGGLLVTHGRGLGWGLVGAGAIIAGTEILVARTEALRHGIASLRGRIEDLEALLPPPELTDPAPETQRRLEVERTLDTLRSTWSGWGFLGPLAPVVAVAVLAAPFLGEGGPSTWLSFLPYLLAALILASPVGAWLIRRRASRSREVRALEASLKAMQAEGRSALPPPSSGSAPGRHLG